MVDATMSKDAGSVINNEQAHVWIYQCSRTFAQEEELALLKEGEAFVSQWKTHGKTLLARFEVYYRRFIVITVDQEVQQLSGCSKDSATHFIKAIEESYNVSLLDRMQVAYWSGDEVKTIHLHDLKEALDSHEITRDTIVFNNLVSTKYEMNTQWEVPLNQSWHERVLN